MAITKYFDKPDEVGIAVSFLLNDQLSIVHHKAAEDEQRSINGKLR